MPDKTIFLIDGSALVYRAFHAIKSLATRQGHPTNATFGFTRILLKLLREHNPTYTSVFFDVKGPTFRHELFEAYKANRPPMPDDLSIQIPDIKKAVSVLSIPMVEKAGYEADDLIGTFARLAQEKGFKVIMVTGDKDFIQLVTSNCYIWDPMKGNIIDHSWIKENMGIEAGMFVDVLSLAGDTADNIPGVKGVGIKTALKLVAEYSSITALYERLEDLKTKKKLYENLSFSRNTVWLNRKLVSIDQYVDVKENIESFKLQSPDRKKAFELFRELEFKELTFEFAAQADKSIKNYTLISDPKALEELVFNIINQGIFAIDTETTSKDPMKAELVGISISFTKDTGVYIPLGHLAENSHDLLDGQLKKEIILSILKPVLENSDIKKIGQNIKYDYIVLKKFGINLRGIFFDTMIASYLLNPSARGHSLDQIAMNLFGYKMITYEQVAGKGKSQKSFARVPINLAMDYASEDADITFAAYEILLLEMKSKGLEDLFNKIEMPLIKVLADMEMAGIRIDIEKLVSLSENLRQELADLEQEIYALAGENFNLNSSQQLGKIFFKKLKLPAIKKTRKKTAYSTDVEVLTKLAGLHALPEKMLRYRTLDKLQSTYAEALRKLIHPDTGRVHTSFNQTITVTGRLSSSNPNLQNIPVKKPEGKKIREIFVPDNGNVLISADYSQIELRILAHCAEDDILIEAFNNDEDIHMRTALEVFQVIPALITNDLRNQAKTINFGIIYGMGAFKLAEELNISRKMAATYIENYFKRYAGVKKFIDTTIARTEDTCETSTIFGRKRRLDDIHSSNANLRNFARRAAINTPIQGSAADLIKLAMIEMKHALTEQKLKSKMLLSVHDEIIFETPREEQEALITLARKIMENVHSLKVDLKVNFGIGKNWAEAH